MKHNVNFTAIKYIILVLGLILGIFALLGLIYYSYKLIRNLYELWIISKDE